MNNITALKSTKTKCESPKTPGGISKSLLTPCRRVGLSRKWRNAGPSPFVSPLSTDNSPRPEPVVEKKLSRKKSRVINTEITEECATQSSQSEPKAYDENIVENIDETNFVSSPADAVVNIVDTPTRSVQNLRKSKSRVSVKDIEVKCEEVPSKTVDKSLKKEFKGCQGAENFNSTITSEEPICQPVRSKSLKKSASLIKRNSATSDQNTKVIDDVSIKPHNNENTIVSKIKKSNSKPTTKPSSPNNLTKECIVVIQKKINKNVLKSNNVEIRNDKTTSDIVKPAINPVSQALFDSDSDEVPLCKINKNRNENKQTDAKKRLREPDLDEDEDFLENTKVKKLEEKNVADLKLKINKKTLQIVKKPPTKTTKALVHSNDNPSSQDSFDDDDDDFDFEKKKTILIRKTYEKVTKPQKAKSTGSITQRDIEELKARIQMKKTQLLAKTMTKDTEELRNLIKRWKKGCQDALVELMDLMKSKCPEKCIDFSKILRMLNIPPALVGYDSDNDSFVSPDDKSIILSKFDV